MHELAAQYLHRRIGRSPSNVCTERPSHITANDRQGG